MKCIVKPTTPFMLSLDGGEVMEFYRPSVVTPSEYLDRFIFKGNVKLLKAELPDEANDRDFHDTWLQSGKDDELAVQSYIASFNEPEETTKSTKKPSATK